MCREIHNITKLENDVRIFFPEVIVFRIELVLLKLILIFVGKFFVREKNVTLKIKNVQSDLTRVCDCCDLSECDFVTCNTMRHVREVL